MSYTSGKRLKIFTCRRTSTRGSDGGLSRVEWLKNEYGLESCNSLEASDIVYFSVHSDVSFYLELMEHQLALRSNRRQKFVFDATDLRISYSGFRYFIYGLGLLLRGSKLATGLLFRPSMNYVTQLVDAMILVQFN